MDKDRITGAGERRATAHLRQIDGTVAAWTSVAADSRGDHPTPTPELEVRPLNEADIGQDASSKLAFLDGQTERFNQIASEFFFGKSS
ncbi:MAG: hypothetical protein IVW54_01800 [Candidatus Binataceae bacterium]|nr:hypothetical protein [Candidatus Binataceae bacterium]